VGRPFSNSFLAGEPAARGFLTLDFREPRDREARARRAAEARVAPAVLDALREQNARLPGSEARAANLRALADGQTAVVATGQQVGLFLGPLYSFYKAASAIAYARRLQRETGVRCVPLFWLQTEDHDFDEIAPATIAGADGEPIVLRLGAGEAEAERTSVAQRTLGPEIVGLVAQLEEALPPGPAAEETLALVRAHYRPGNGVAAAFAGVMASLFADEGLIFLDPRDARVAGAAAPVYRAALEGAGALEACFDQRRAALAAAGFGEQIAVRPGCALLFFHRDGVSGPRFRLERAPEGDWRLSGTGERVSDAEVAEALAREPLRFSTSALLRPIVQDTLLPVAAYVGGPAEVSYFAQLPPAYAHLGVEAPLVIPRARFRCTAARARRLLEELGLSADDLARPEAELLARLPANAPAGAPTPAALRARVAAEIAPVVEAITREVQAADPQLSRGAERTRASVAHALERLTARYERTLVTRDGVALARLRRLRADLAPGGAPQERVYAWPSLAGRHGPAALKRLVLDALDANPFPTRLLELTP
jgi:bacillithiol biosynthesis cysteine-adding enzyme BshC